VSSETDHVKKKKLSKVSATTNGEEKAEESERAPNWTSDSRVHLIDCCVGLWNNPKVKETSVGKITERILEKAVKGMLPKTKLGNALFNNLFVYTGSEHPHAAQQPKKININDLR
jgi:hypothetical protein